jgi:hypothetical protein
VRRVGIAVAALAFAVGLVACGEKTVDADNAATTIADFVERETGFAAADVECPDDVNAEVGETFECTFTGPEGPYVAEVEITDVEGDDATFDIRTRRAG